MTTNKVKSILEADDLRHWDGYGPDPNTDEELSYPWRLNDGRSGVTQELCNAIRCAAEDGLTYREIMGLFDTTGNRSTARQHAVGECRHSGGVRPIREGRTVGENPSAIHQQDCRELRKRWQNGGFETYDDAADWVGAAHSTTYRHINGKCSHD